MTNGMPRASQKSTDGKASSMRRLSTRITAPMAPLATSSQAKRNRAWPGRAEQVEHQARVERDAPEVEGDGGGHLGGHRAVVDAEGHLGERRLGGDRHDLGDGADEGGLAGAVAAAHDELHRHGAGALVERVGHAEPGHQRLEAGEDALEEDAVDGAVRVAGRAGRFTWTKPSAARSATSTRTTPTGTPQAGGHLGHAVRPLAQPHDGGPLEQRGRWRRRRGSVTTIASTGIGAAAPRRASGRARGRRAGRATGLVVVRGGVEVAGAHRSSAPCSSARSSGVSTEPARSTNTAIS